MYIIIQTKIYITTFVLSQLQYTNMQGGRKWVELCELCPFEYCGNLSSDFHIFCPWGPVMLSFKSPQWVFTDQIKLQHQTPPSQHRINAKSLRFCSYRHHAVWQEWLIVFYSVCCANFSAVVYLEGQSVRSVWVLGTGSVQAYGNFDKTHIWNVTLSNSLTVTKSASK